MPEKPIVIHLPEEDGRRRVTIRGEMVGRAGSVAGVEEFLRRAGIHEPESLDQDWVEWRGGGPAWE